MRPTIQRTTLISASCHNLRHSALQPNTEKTIIPAPKNTRHSPNNTQKPRHNDKTSFQNYVYKRIEQKTNLKSEPKLPSYFMESLEFYGGFVFSIFGISACQGSGFLMASGKWPFCCHSRTFSSCLRRACVMIVF
jgi:hypothetical protein